jgi:hypothetical protein
METAAAAQDYCAVVHDCFVYCVGLPVIVARVTLRAREGAVLVLHYGVAGEIVVPTFGCDN